MLIDGRTGERGCDKCGKAIMVTIDSKAGLVELCWEDSRSLTGWTTEQLEAATAPFQDHVLAAFKRGIPADIADTKRWLGIGRAGVK